MTECGATGPVFDGRYSKCDREAGHDEPTSIYLDRRGEEVSYFGNVDPGDPTATPIRIDVMPHRMVIEWL